MTPIGYKQPFRETVPNVRFAPVNGPRDWDLFGSHNSCVIRLPSPRTSAGSRGDLGIASQTLWSASSRRYSGFRLRGGFGRLAGEASLTAVEEAPVVNPASALSSPASSNAGATAEMPVSGP